jgi:beta-hydroxylase
MVARLLAPQFVIVYLFAASAAYVHFRAKMKLRLGRQLADHSTWLAPYNVLTLIVVLIVASVFA